MCRPRPTCVCAVWAPFRRVNTVLLSLAPSLGEVFMWVEESSGSSRGHLGGPGKAGGAREAEDENSGEGGEESLRVKGV